MQVRDAARRFGVFFAGVPLGLAILGCAGGLTDAADGDATDGAEEDEEEEDEDAVPDGVVAEESGRWVPEKGRFTYELELTSGDDERTALVHVPRDDETKDLPLVLVFHGGKSGNDAKRMAPFFEKQADAGVVFAFPNGLPGGERAWAGPDDERDLDFVADLIDELDDRISIDRDRVYATGFSNGAGMVWMLQCERDELFAGFGHVQQSMPKVVADECKPKSHTPFVWFHGDSDKKAPWDGGRDTLSVDDTMAFWKDAHQCAIKHSRLDWMPDVDKDGTIPELYRYEDCKDVPALHLYKIKGGVHAWPSTEGVGKSGEGRSKDVDATQATLDFWRKHAGL